MPLVLLAVFTITLALGWGLPGNPLDASEGRQPPPEVKEAMLAQYNLDSFPRFYASYLYNASGLRWAWQAVRGEPGADQAAAHRPPPSRAVFDLGPSLHYQGWRVNEILASALPVSAVLGLLAILIALAIGVVAGVVGAVRPGSWADGATLAIALVGISLPPFVVGTVLLLAFTVWIPVFPVGGWGVRQAVLPALTLSLPFAAYIARLTRMGMIEQLGGPGGAGGADYIRTARAKGLPESVVLFKHALKNAFLPVLSFLGPATAAAMTGSFVVEKVFSVPGLGQHFVNAVLNKDLFLVMGVVLVYATMLILFNLAVDVLYRWVDPRIR
jgi:oligopeptide transport system permease protein